MITVKRLRLVEDYSTDCLLDYTYSEKYNTMIAIDLNKQQLLDADTKIMEQINFAENLNQA